LAFTDQKGEALMVVKSQVRNNSKVRVVLVDDNPPFLNAVSEYLARASQEIELVGVALDIEEVLELASSLHPHLILLCLDKPDQRDLGIVSELKTILPGGAIIILSLLDSKGYRRSVLEAGADDFIPKHNLIKDLLPSVRRLFGNGQWN
jgi:DNA-binding NarL/FixJ family response regulator